MLVIVFMYRSWAFIYVRVRYSFLNKFCDLSLMGAAQQTSFNFITLICGESMVMVTHSNDF